MPPYSSCGVIQVSGSTDIHIALETASLHFIELTLSSKGTHNKCINHEGTNPEQQESSDYINLKKAKLQCVACKSN